MGLLGDRFREAMKKTKDARMDEASFDIMYPTGFYPFDYSNGYRVHVVPDDGSAPFSYNSIGIVDGSATMFIGRSGCGKTSFAIQAAANIVRPFPDAMIFYDDIEGGSNATRREKLTGFSGEELDRRMVYRNSAVSAETFYSRIYTIYEEKIKHKADYEYDTGWVDNRGYPIYKLQPTVYILDSLAMLTPDKITEEEELTGQMSATAAAKSNTAVFKRIIPKLKSANIILFTINHINDDVEINPYAKKKAQVAWLKQGEVLPGGKAAQYLANNMVRIDDTTKLKETDGLGVRGKIVEFSLVKSRTNSPGIPIPMLFDYQDGFNADLSLFTFLKSSGAIESKGAYMNIPGTEIKFTQKEFLSKLHTDPAFATEFSNRALISLEALLGSGEVSPEEVQNNADIIGSILNPGIRR